MLSVIGSVHVPYHCHFFIMFEDQLKRSYNAHVQNRCTLKQDLNRTYKIHALNALKKVHLKLLNNWIDSYMLLSKLHERHHFIELIISRSIYYHRKSIYFPLESTFRINNKILTFTKIILMYFKYLEFICVRCICVNAPGILVLSPTDTFCSRYYSWHIIWFQKTKASIIWNRPFGNARWGKNDWNKLEQTF